MVTGQISFAQVCALMFAGLGFGGYLHNKSWGVWILLIGVIGFILSRLKISLLSLIHNHNYERIIF